MPNLPATVRPVDLDGNPVALGLWARDRAIIACNRGLVYGLAGTNPPCACGSVVGACCISGQCSQVSALACAGAGGMFLGGPCLAGTCDVPPPGCCSGGCLCFIQGADGETYSVSANIRLTAHHCYTGGGCPVPDNDSSYSINEQRTIPDGGICNYAAGVGVRSQNDYGPGGTISVTATFVACPTLPSGDPTPAIIVDVGHVPVVIVPVSCGGGSFDVSFPPFVVDGAYSWSNVRAVGQVTVSRARRCDGQPEIGRCCTRSNGLFDGGCQQLTHAECLAVSGDWRYGATCATMPCIGVCCIPGSPCFVTSEFNCLQGIGAVWHGFDTDCGTTPCVPPAPCCQDASCNKCHIPPLVSVGWTMRVTTTADLYHASGPNCDLFESGVLNSIEDGGNLQGQDLCAYETTQVIATLTATGAQPLAVSAQYFSCGGTADSARIVVFAAGITTSHAIPCTGDTIEVFRPGGGGAACGSGREWRNIRVVVQVSIPLANQCSGTILRASKKIILPRGVAGGCKGCGDGGTKGLLI